MPPSSVRPNSMRSGQGRVRVGGSELTTHTIKLAALDAPVISVGVVGFDDAAWHALEPQLRPDASFRWIRLGWAEAERIDEGSNLAVLLFAWSRNSAGHQFLAKFAGPRRMPPLIAVAEVPEGEREALALELAEHGVVECLAAASLTGPLIELAVRATVQITQLEQQVRQLRDRLAITLHGSQEGLFEWDLRRDEVFFSQRWAELLGHTADEIGARPDEWLGRVHPHDAPRMRRELEQLLAGQVTDRSSEYRMRAKDGRWLWISCRTMVYLDGGGRPVRLAGSIRDVTDYHRREQELRERARVDRTTDLPKRHAFMQHLARAIELARDHEDYVFCVLLVDIDRFSRVNESLGTTIADALLGAVAKRLLGCLRLDDKLARFDADSFIILLEDLDGPGDGSAVANRIHEAMREPFDIEGHQLYAAVSIGMTSSARSYRSVDDVLADASIAVARAREAGRESPAIFETQMRIEAVTMLRLEMALRQAVERAQFELHYQPIVALATGNVIGFEALVRWNHPRQGMISPADFIPVAENTGLVVPLGRWALREAARQLRAWLDDPRLADRVPPTLSVNVSSRQVASPRWIDDVAAALGEHKIGPGLIRLELTESVLLESAELATDLIGRLGALGAQVFIDDFGTGYSSLSYLHRLPVDGLKIDKSFIDSLDGSERGAMMVRTMIELARQYGIAAIAEGIESADQRRELLELGCLLGQGYLFSKPLTAAAAFEYLLAH